MRLLSPATTFAGLGNYKSKDLWRSAKENRDMAANITAEWNARGIDVVIGPGRHSSYFCARVSFTVVSLVANGCELQPRLPFPRRAHRVPGGVARGHSVRRRLQLAGLPGRSRPCDQRERCRPTSETFKKLK